MQIILFLAATISCICKINAEYFVLTSNEGNEYNLFIGRKWSWFEAVQGCAALDRALVTIDSYDKQMEIATMLKEKSTTQSFLHLRLWTAGHDNAQQGVYTWLSNGQELKYTNWASGEPNNDQGNEHCIEMRPGDFLWNDVPCSTQLSYICEGRQIAECTTLLDGVHNLQELRLDELNRELKDLKDAHEIEMNILLQSQQEQLQDKNKEMENVRKTNEIELSSLLQKNKDDSEAIKKFHAQVMDDHGLEVDALQKAHEDAMGIILQEKQNELNDLKNATAAERILVLEAIAKKWDNKTSLITQEKIEILKAQLSKEMEKLKDDQTKAENVEILNKKKSYEKDLNALRQEKASERGALQGLCNGKVQQLAESKNKEISGLQKANDELQRDRTNSFKFYSFVFHGNGGGSNKNKK